MRTTLTIVAALCAACCVGCKSDGLGWHGVTGATADAAEAPRPAAVEDAATTVETGTLAERRQALFDAVQTRGAGALPLLKDALSDDNALVRRAAAGLLASLGEAGAPALDAAISNEDPIVRRTAALAAAHRGAAGAPVMERALQDPDEDVRVAVSTALAAMQPRSEEILRLLRVAQKDPSLDVRKPASQALWPFHKEVMLFRERPDVRDRLASVTVTATIPMPLEDWRFKTDEAEDGHVRKWYDPACDDSAWAKIPIGDFWQKAGYEYEGVAWYRRAFALPAQPDASAVEMHFGAVDESAWIWINGEYAGQFDVGPSGWMTPFAIDVTSLLRWGAENHIAVRVLNTKFAGGIWKPVTIEAIKVK